LWIAGNIPNRIDFDWLKRGDGIVGRFQYRNGTIDEFEKLIRRQFDMLYAERAHSGRVMAICLHPYLIGVPHRIAGLDSALQYIRSHHRVWFATGEQIVRAWLQSGATF
jgi:hypothetical protein